MTSLKDSRINDKDKRKAKKLGYTAIEYAISAEVEAHTESPIDTNEKPTKIKKSKKGNV